MKLKVLTPQTYDYLASKIDDFALKYVEATPFKFQESPFVNALIESRITVHALPDLETSRGASDDLVNAVKIHSALQTLSRSQAAESRLWTSLCHDHYWEYCCKRWPCCNAQNLRSYVKEHYFAEGPRALVRNGIARLWWFGEAAFDPERENPYELISVLLATAETRQTIMEHEFWRNPIFLRRFLSALAKLEQDGDAIHTRRNEFRTLVKRLNTIGGVQVLDVLPEDTILSLMKAVSTSSIS